VPSTEPLRRGDVVRVRFDPTEGSEQAGMRPALIVSPDIVNEHAPVVLVAAITSRKTDRVYAFEARIDPPDGGLDLVSKVSALQMRGIDKRRIEGRYGSLDPDTMRSVDEAIRVATGLRAL
jgi:mRNA interferase MazF